MEVGKNPVSEWPVLSPMIKSEFQIYIKSPSDRGASRESDESQPDRNLSICGTREGKTHVSFSERSELLLQSERRQNC